MFKCTHLYTVTQDNLKQKRNTMKPNQKGFTLIEGLLIVITLSLVTGVGYYVYNAKQDNKATTQSTVATAKNKTVATKKDLLVVSELGVKFDKSAAPGAYYKIDTSSYSDTPEIKTLKLYDTAYDNTTNTKGTKCKDVKFPYQVANVEIISVSERDSKYSKYKNAEINPPADTVSQVLSDKYAKQANGFLYMYYKYQGVQAGIGCITDAFGPSDDNQTVEKANSYVGDKYDASVKSLEQMVDSIEKS